MNLQSSLVSLFWHLIHYTRQRGNPILPICQVCQVEYLHIHPDILPTPVVIQAVLTHLWSVSCHRFSIPFPAPVATVSPNRDDTIGEVTIRASLISVVSDKLRWQRKEEMDHAQAGLNALKQTEEDLKKGDQKLEEMVTRLDQEVVPLYKQILNLYAEENAIEDTIFYLGEALRWGVIGLGVFLKHVHLLSHKQFQLGALMQKARKTANLCDLY
uniref:SB domain-containing protein n=1 Tax=Canis lupus familiaris TaxID=9615 RepID=A0A8C0SVX8_CANLF